jgi:hypothetical protein
VVADAEILGELLRCFPSFEREVFKGLVDGASLSELARRMRKDRGTVARARIRIRERVHLALGLTGSQYGSTSGRVAVYAPVHERADKSIETGGVCG